VFVLRIEHPVPDYDNWKRAFDNDPLDRKGSGVVSYRVLRAPGTPTIVTVDLEFERREQAEAMQAKLLQLWGRVEQEGLIGQQQARIFELTDRVSL
jgi:hypothetical protein